MPCPGEGSMWTKRNLRQKMAFQVVAEALKRPAAHLQELHEAGRKLAVQEGKAGRRGPCSNADA